MAVLGMASGGSPSQARRPARGADARRDPGGIGRLSLRRKGLVGVVVTVAALLAGVEASAQNAQVEQFLRRGVALRQQGRDVDALEAFLRARELSDEPRVLAQVALAEQALGRWVDAAQHLRAATAREDDPWIRRNTAALAGARDEIMRHVGGLRVRGPGARGELRVDGSRVATLPAGEASVVLAGSREIEVREAGTTPWRRRVDVAAGALTEVEVPAQASETPVPQGFVSPSRSRGGAQRTAGWSLVGVSALGLGAGFYGLLARDAAQRDFDGDPQCQGGGALPTVCRDRVDTADTMNAVMIAGFVSAGVLVATGVALVATAPSSRAAVTRLVCAPGLRSFGCALTF